MLKHATTPRAARRALTAVLSGLAFAATAAPPADTQRIGQRHYEKTCAMCHEAGVGPTIKGRGIPAATYMVIARNGMNAMPAFRVTDMDDATLQAVAEYLASTPVPAGADAPATK